MIVHCNFEELTALKAGARQVLDGYAPEHGMIAAPPEEREQVAALLPRLGGDFSVTTLAEQRSLLHAVTIIVEMLRVEMESMVAANHPAHEVAVSAYFDFAHAFSVQARLYEVGLEMEALIELVTGEPVTEDNRQRFRFSGLILPSPSETGDGVPGDRNTRGASFSEEAVPHMDAVYRFALRLTGARDEAEDLVQDTYLRAFRAWEQYEPGTRCKSWLFTICRNVFLRRRERSQRHDEILLETAHDDPRAISREAPVFAASRDEDPEGEFFRSIVDDQVFAAIDELSEEYRMVVVLSDLEDLSYGEIAEVMEIPVGTVKSRLFRGRRQLQRRLYDYALEMGYISDVGEN